MPKRKGYPRTRFEILNQTTVQEITQDLAGDSLVPVAMAAYTSDKGSEDWQEFTNLSDFVNQTGDPASGTISKNHVEVIYHYKIKDATLTIKYVDQDDNDIDSSVNTINAPKHWGDTYS